MYEVPAAVAQRAQVALPDRQPAHGAPHDLCVTPRMKYEPMLPPCSFAFPLPCVCRFSTPCAVRVRIKAFWIQLMQIPIGLYAEQEFALYVSSISNELRISVWFASCPALHFTIELTVLVPISERPH